MRTAAKDATKDLENRKGVYCDAKQGHHLANTSVRMGYWMDGEADDKPIISTASPDAA